MRTLCLLFVLCAAAFAQLDSDSITITASGQTALLQPDVVRVWISVSATQGMELAAVLTALASLPVSERDLISFGGPGFISVCNQLVGSCNPTTAWTFSFTAPLAKLNETLKTLARIDAARTSGMSISYSVGSDVSNPARPECAYPTLISQARRHADNVAGAAGLRVGGIVAMADGSGFPQPYPSQVIYDPLTTSRGGDFSAVALFGVITRNPFPVIAPTCAVAVQFKLLR